MLDQEKNVGERIKCLRLEREMAIDEVALASGLDAATIEAVESQSLSPPLGNIVSIAKALRVSLGDLFDDDADSPTGNCVCIVDDSSEN